MIHVYKDWFLFSLFNWICISLENPFKTMKKLKGVFIPLTRCFTTNFVSAPIIWCSKPKFIHIVSHDVGWKDKWDTPRYEHAPYIWIHIFKWDWIWYWDFKPHRYEIYDYWEQALWYLHYYGTYSQGLLVKPNIDKAKESWPWENYDTKESSWNDNFLVK